MDGSKSLKVGEWLEIKPSRRKQSLTAGRQVNVHRVPS